MKYTHTQLQLANEIAHVLQDRKSIAQYLRFAQNEDEAFLRDTLSYVLSLPDSDITNSRGALFNHIVMKHAEAKGAGA
jgi:hypothetical protein